MTDDDRGRDRRERLADLTWAFPAERPEGRGPLSRDEIVAAAIRLADRDGLDALSMRRLGTELGAGATSLYWHVKNRDQLEDLMLDSLIGEVMDDLVPAEGWRDQLAELARALRRALLRHRNIAPLLGERPTLGPHALDAAETVMAVMFAAGFDARTTSLASGALINYASGFALFESKAPGGADSPEAQAMADAVMAYFRALPVDRYPTLMQIAKQDVTEDEQFEYGLQRFLDGLEADLSAGHRPAKPRRPSQTGNAMLRR